MDIFYSPRIACRVVGHALQTEGTPTNWPSLCARTRSRSQLLCLVFRSATGATKEREPFYLCHDRSDKAVGKQLICACIKSFDNARIYRDDKCRFASRQLLRHQQVSRRVLTSRNIEKRFQLFFPVIAIVFNERRARARDISRLAFEPFFTFWLVILFSAM